MPEPTIRPFTLEGPRGDSADLHDGQNRPRRSDDPFDGDWRVGAFLERVRGLVEYRRSDADQLGAGREHVRAVR